MRDRRNEIDMINQVTAFRKGEAPRGWTKTGWINHLRKIADACEPHVPERAKKLRVEADRIEKDQG